MKRQSLHLRDIAAYPNLLLALSKAARGKTNNREIRYFNSSCDKHLQELQSDIVFERAPTGEYRSFTIFDPKKRRIQAVSFKDRILHHAIMNLAEPSLNRALIDQTYACRKNKGVHAAIQQVQHNSRRFPWYVQIDVQHYFDNIDHDILFELLCHRFKGSPCLRLLQRVIESYKTLPGKGLPIGALTSQHFANYYLDRVDRQMLAHRLTMGYVRYMDDMLWWCKNKADAHQTLGDIKSLLRDTRKLDIKPSARIQRSAQGIRFCGQRVLPGQIRLTPRKKQRYQHARRELEHAYECDDITSRILQQSYACVLAAVTHCDSRAWRRDELIRNGSVDA